MRLDFRARLEQHGQVNISFSFPSTLFFFFFDKTFFLRKFYASTGGRTRAVGYLLKLFTKVWLEGPSHTTRPSTLCMVSYYSKVLIYFRCLCLPVRSSPGSRTLVEESIPEIYYFIKKELLRFCTDERILQPT